MKYVGAMWEDNRRWTLALLVLLWIMDSYFGQKQQFKEFVLYKNTAFVFLSH